MKVTKINEKKDKMTEKTMVMDKTDEDEANKNDEDKRQQKIEKREWGTVAYGA